MSAPTRRHPEQEPALEHALHELPLHDPPAGMQASIMHRVRLTHQQPAPLNRGALAAATAATLALLAAGLSLAWTWLPRLLTPEAALVLRMQTWYLLQRLEYQLVLAVQAVYPPPVPASWNILFLGLGALSLGIAILLFTGLGIGLQFRPQTRLDR